MRKSSKKRDPVSKIRVRVTMKKPRHITREGWLLEATKRLRPLFKQHGKPIPKKVMVGCGWPRGGKSEVIGQCFAKTWTEDGTSHIFISPTQADAVSVLATLVHELVHATVGCEHGHRGEFKRLARAVGLEGKLTATTVSEKSPLHPELKKIAAILGTYPHSRMNPDMGRRRASGGNVNWIRLRSKKMANYTLVISRLSIKNFGWPLDPSGDKMVEK